MLRYSLLYLSHQKWIRRWAERSRVSRKLTRRFVAGQALEDEIRVISTLAREHIGSTLDFLGENVTSLDEAFRCQESYLSALKEIKRANLPATVSIKLTQFGLDFSEEACQENVSCLAERAADINSRIEIDMEASEYTDRTLRIVHNVQNRFPGHVRAVIQAYLHRSESDIRELSSREIPVRLCKGAYREPAAVAFSGKRDVDRNYLKLLKLLLEEGTDPAIASHDENMIRAAIAHAQEQKLARDRFEFQMLYGIRRDLQRELVAQGYRLRLYVPYGEAWYPYFMRRLAERPANLLFLAKNLIRS